MTAFSAFYPFIRPDMPGCPDIAIDLELARVSNHFCSNGWVYRATVTENVVSGDESISPTLPSGSELLGVVSAIKDSERQFYDFTIDGDDIVLDETATYDFDLELILALKQPMTATDVPDILFRDHLDAVTFGVKSRLFASPNKSWTDNALAAYYDQLYRQELSKYTTKAFIDKSRRDTRCSGGRFI